MITADILGQCYHPLSQLRAQNGKPAQCGNHKLMKAARISARKQVCGCTRITRFVGKLQVELSNKYTNAVIRRSPGYSSSFARLYMLAG